MIHELKINPESFQAVVSGNKKAEVRSSADRSFLTGDRIFLNECSIDGRINKANGRRLQVIITHVESWGQPGDQVVLSIEIVK